MLADRKRQVGDIDGRHRNILMGTATADADGRFTLEFPAIPAESPGPPGPDRRRARAGPRRSIDLKTDAARQETSIALPPEKPVEGRLVDVQGQPAAGVVVRVAGLSSASTSSSPTTRRAGRASGRRPRRPTPTAGSGCSGWAPDAPATYEVEDPRYAHQAFSFHAEDARREGQLRPGTTITLRPAQAVEVHVVHADDGKPAAGARVDVQSEEGMSHYPTDERRPRPDRRPGPRAGRRLAGQRVPDPRLSARGRAVPPRLARHRLAQGGRAAVRRGEAPARRRSCAAG